MKEEDGAKESPETKAFGHLEKKWQRRYLLAGASFVLFGFAGLFLGNWVAREVDAEQRVLVTCLVTVPFLLAWLGAMFYLVRRARLDFVNALGEEVFEQKLEERQFDYFKMIRGLSGARFAGVMLLHVFAGAHAFELGGSVVTGIIAIYGAVATVVWIRSRRDFG